jgi:hypothetical protein
MYACIIISFRIILHFLLLVPIILSQVILIPNYKFHQNNYTFCQIIFQNRNVRKIKHVNLSLRSACCWKYII